MPDALRPIETRDSEKYSDPTQLFSYRCELNETSPVCNAHRRHSIGSVYLRCVDYFCGLEIVPVFDTNPGK